MSEEKLLADLLRMLTSHIYISAHSSALHPYSEIIKENPLFIKHFTLRYPDKWWITVTNEDLLKSKEFGCEIPRNFKSIRNKMLKDSKALEEKRRKALEEKRKQQAKKKTSKRRSGKC